MDFINIFFALIIFIFFLIVVSFPVWFAILITILVVRKHKTSAEKYQEENKRLVDEYFNSTYFKITNKSYYDMITNSGSQGEYSVYKSLKHFESLGCKFLFNLYVPYADNKTTEIDILLIHPSGLFVIESKNFNGWIFGDQNSKTWTQCLSAGHGRYGHYASKEHFYNPIWQNKKHIQCLSKYLKKNLSYLIPLRSIIAFSDYCSFKTQIKDSDSAYVVHYNEINNIINYDSSHRGTILNAEQINEIYEKLYPLTQVTEEDKVHHIENIKKTYH